MKKISNKGFMLVETLVVTSFVAGVLIFMYIQFTNLSNKYNESYDYNTVEGLYSLENIKEYIEEDQTLLIYADNFQAEGNPIDPGTAIDITECSSEYFSDINYCSLLFELENIEEIYLTCSWFDKNSILDIYSFSSETKKFINKIKIDESDTGYRLIAKFTDGTFATIRLGE